MTVGEGGFRWVKVCTFGRGCARVCMCGGGGVVVVGRSLLVRRHMTSGVTRQAASGGLHGRADGASAQGNTPVCVRGVDA